MESGVADTGARRATIADVARAAGVAVGTASDALNGKGRVAPATRARVREAARVARLPAGRRRARTRDRAGDGDRGSGRPRAA